ncbi:MAG: hypothetical protein CMN56_05305 [Sneathiella sp.]|uniref:hypothetical protein n=1 Tax=Sneathiella sp. TaxID=1964365 RepID=UPI000C4FB527|nr:hypothetical protein [Sneathiella sp.]MAZ02537.1 hypothetical protein [Sneathiella sp.]
MNDRKHFAQSTNVPKPHWPQNVRSISVEGLENLGISDSGELYWDGKRLKVENKVTLNLWQNTLAAITAGSALVVAAVSVIAYICPPQ